MATRLISVKIKETGIKSTIVYFNQLKQEIPNETDRTSRDLIERAKNEVITEISKYTKGFGILNSSFIEQYNSRGRYGGTYSLIVIPPGNLYWRYVDKGFTPHWVRISDKPYLADWIKKNMSSNAAKIIRKNRIFIGGANSAPWIRNGGIRFSDKANNTVLNLSKSEYRNRINKVIKTIKRGK